MKQLYSRRMIAFYICMIMVYISPEQSQYIMALGLAIIGSAALDGVKKDDRK